MDVLIRGMKIPASCADCDMIELSGAIGCKHAYDHSNSSWGRALNCPLIKLPDHGDLIDRDVMAKSLADDVEMDEKALDSMDIVGVERQKLQFDKDCKQNCMYYLTEQEAVIPAERSEE